MASRPLVPQKKSAAAPRVLIASALLVVAGLIAWHNSFSGPFIFDDYKSILENTTIRSLGTALFPPGNSGLTVSGRPMLNLSLALNYALGGTDVRGYHAVNLALHILGALTLFGIVRRTLALPAMRARFATDATWLAPVVALLWLVHPLQTESVTYVVQRAESLVGFFYLLTLYFFIRGVEATGRAAWRWNALTVVACALGMASKEVMASAPVILFLFDRTFVTGSFGDAWKRRRFLYVALASTWLLLGWLIWSTGNRGGTAGFGSGTNVPSYALTQCEAIVMYLKLAVWPSPLVLDYGERLVDGFADVWPQALVLVALLTATVVALVRKPALGFLGVFFFAVLAPTSSVVPVATQTMAEHRMYLPLAAVVAALVFALRALAGRRSLIALAPVVVVFVALTIRRNHDYRSSDAIWSDTIAKVPENGRPYVAIGVVLEKEGRFEEACAALEKAMAYGASGGADHGLYGNVLLEVGRVDEAIEQYRMALAMLPDDARAHSGHGNALLRIGKIDEALVELREAVRLDPKIADSHYNLANALAAMGDFARAVTSYREAIKLQPDFAEGRFNLGNALAITGKLDEAITEFRAVVAQRPEIVDAWCNLGNALAQSGRTEDAEKAFREALRRAPNHPEARAGLERLGVARGAR